MVCRHILFRYHFFLKDQKSLERTQLVKFEACQDPSSVLHFTSNTFFEPRSSGCSSEQLGSTRRATSQNSSKDKWVAVKLIDNFHSDLMDQAISWLFFGSDAFGSVVFSILVFSICVQSKSICWHHDGTEKPLKQWFKHDTIFTMKFYIADQTDSGVSNQVVGRSLSIVPATFT